jgi:hypothetical protein
MQAPMKRFNLDPGQMTLDHFKELTRNKRLVPGRVALQEQMDERYEILERSGIESLGDLLRLLNTRSKIENFSKRSGLSADYLVLLRREAGSYLAKPFPLSDFPGIPYEYTESLKSKGIKSTSDLFEKLQSEHQQVEMAAGTGIPVYRLKELFSLCDLSRITGVGGLFARVIYEAGIRSLSEFAQTEASSQVMKYRSVIKKYNYPAAIPGIDDIRYCIDYARIVAHGDNKSD